MTIIVAISNGKTVMMGADAAAVGESDMLVRTDPKIYRVGDFLIGFSHSFRVGQLVGNKFIPPPPNHKHTDYKYMCTRFVDELAALFRANDVAHGEDGEGFDGELLVGYNGKIYYIGSDLHVGTSLFDFNAIGSGSQTALGSLYSTRGTKTANRIYRALKAAEEFNPGIRGPFLIETIGVAE